MISIKFIKYVIKISGLFLRPINYKGFYKVLKFFNFITTDKLTLINLTKSKKFVFNLNDPYWSLLIANGYIYEKEIYHYKKKILNSFSSVNSLMFLDLGSNIGYWSIIFSDFLETSNIIAVEPNPLNNKIHNLNRYINNLDYLVLERAVTSKDNENVKLIIDHENITSVGSHITNLNTTEEFINVKTISIPSIMNDIEEECYWIIKLDIEGAEIDALDFLKSYSKNNLFIIYEDHGRDNLSKISNYLINLRYDIYHWNGKDNILVTLEEINKIKKNKKKGYNFLAIKS